MSGLEFQTLAELCAEVDAAGPRRWLVRGVWPAGAYGVHAAEMKAQKTWNALDLAVSVASETPWLGFLAIDDPGPVVVFAGEGGKASIVRRLRAVCASRGLQAEHLPIVVCARAPHLSDREHLAVMAEQLEAVRPRLVVLDPLYLAAGGADGKDLYAMGRLLERPQHMCDQIDASLFVVTHYNRREGTGPSRFTGAGPAEWGRVLIGATVVSRSTDPTTLATTVVVELDVVGGEIPDQTFRVKREIRADDSDDLNSALHYTVEVAPAEPADTGKQADWKPTVLMGRVVRFLEAQTEPVSRNEIAKAVTGKRKYILHAIGRLVDEGTIRETGRGLALSAPPLEVVPESGSPVCRREPGTGVPGSPAQVVPGTTGNQSGTGNHREAA